MAQALAAATRTPIQVLWPPASDPAVATALDAVRLQQDIEDAKARDGKRHQDAAARLSKPIEAAWAAPEASAPPPTFGETSRSSYGLHRQIEATNREAVGSRRPGRRRRVLIPAAASIAVAVAAGTAIATTSGDEPPVRQATPVVQAGPTAAERQRAAQQATLVEAKGRGDYDAAITAATSLNDTATVAELRTAAGGIFARRARQAADRGDLPLAASRLDRAEDRYGDSPAIDGVRRRIEQIKDARQKRAAERKRAAKKRAAARARAAAAARRAAPAPSSPAPSGSSASPVPSSPAPSSPTPSPRPSPAPSTGGSGGGSGGGSSSGGGSKGGGSSSGGAVDPGLY
ncbi:unannotated protein [freshwater metagenome]|uniref:Unannotated protein n=1 Tax=freshwater metagenome TaxID=449393 RepID=A0A6J7FEF2_9ZZZZ